MEKPGHEHISMVVPAFNEERRIERTITIIAEYMNRQRSPYDIIVSDDGSVDGTGDIVMALQRRPLPIQLVRNPRNEGKGSAVRRGVSVSSGDLVLVTDADLATPIEELEPLLAQIRAGADIAIGSRGMRESRLVRRQPIYREMMGRLFNVLVQLTILPGVFDTQCGFKLFRGPVARRLFEHATIDGFTFDVEILGLAARAEYRLAEVPVRWSHVNHSKVSLGRDSVGMFRDMLKVAYRLRSGWYDLEAVAAALPEKP
jgi:dolichyl-phosphate beta-glucosyltransferase